MSQKQLKKLVDRKIAELGIQIKVNRFAWAYLRELKHDHPECCMATGVLYTLLNAREVLDKGLLKYTVINEGDKLETEPHAIWARVESEVRPHKKEYTLPPGDDRDFMGLFRGNKSFRRGTVSDYDVPKRSAMVA